jgi:hypothetical protein
MAIQLYCLVTAESTVWFGAVVGGFGARVWVVLKFPFANWLPLMSDATRTLWFGVLMSKQHRQMAHLER